MTNGVSPFTKVIVGALLAGLAVLLVATGADSAGGTSIVSSEWVKCAIAVVTTAGILWGIPSSVTQDQVDAFLAKEALAKRAKTTATRRLTSDDD